MKEEVIKESERQKERKKRKKERERLTGRWGQTSGNPLNPDQSNNHLPFSTIIPAISAVGNLHLWENPSLMMIFLFLYLPTNPNTGCCDPVTFCIEVEDDHAWEN